LIMITPIRFLPLLDFFCADGTLLRHRLERALLTGSACSSRSRRAAKGSTKN
jgi:hypothetical protein